ncbi:MAG: hypothetical protein JXQ87_13655 [Bacteroidia bacterium]
MKELIRKIIFTALSVFLIYQTINTHLALLKVWSNDTGFSLISEFFIAGFLALCITGVFAFPGFCFPTHKLIWPKYFEVKNEKRLTKVYNALGIKYFRKFLMLAYWGKEKNRNHFFNGTRNGFKNFDYQTKQAEFGHLLPFVLLCIDTIFLLALNLYVACVILFTLNVIGNLYPVILQRKSRARLQRIYNRPK